MREPELTIGTPVYDSASTVRAALESLLAQTYEKFVSFLLIIRLMALEKSAGNTQAAARAFTMCIRRTIAAQ
jgi:hypothetical protein